MRSLCGLKVSVYIFLQYLCTWITVSSIDLFWLPPKYDFYTVLGLLMLSRENEPDFSMATGPPCPSFYFENSTMFDLLKFDFPRQGHTTHFAIPVRYGSEYWDDRIRIEFARVALEGIRQSCWTTLQFSMIKCVWQHSLERLMIFVLVGGALPGARKLLLFSIGALLSQMMRIGTWVELWLWLKLSGPNFKWKFVMLRLLVNTNVLQYPQDYWKHKNNITVNKKNNITANCYQLPCTGIRMEWCQVKASISGLELCYVVHWA